MKGQGKGIAKLTGDLLVIQLLAPITTTNAFIFGHWEHEMLLDLRGQRHQSPIDPFDVGERELDQLVQVAQFKEAAGVDVHVFSKPSTVPFDRHTNLGN